MDEFSFQNTCKICVTNCCEGEGGPTILEKELQSINKFLKQNNKQNYLKKLPYSSNYFIPRTENKCPYLMEDGCDLKEARPIECKIYPYNFTDKKELGLSIDCPASKLMQEVFENKVKKELSKLSESEIYSMIKGNERDNYIFVNKEKLKT